ncbi:MAG: hypothetical protein JF625_07970 [Inquilinus limosus]|uniref:Type II secretion system protein GspC N-terminal domain-containing protein n=1 Tax=Inquilinus limosus TaxID=171674 RepID=A0A952FIL7_9PROT|nr:hypothetical protein [Inquilinus limosus]
MAWHPLTRMLVVLGPLAIGISYLLGPDDPVAVPAVVRSGNAQAALPPTAPAAEPRPTPLVAPELSDLTATVERPLFTPGRRGPQPPPPVAEAPPPEAPPPTPPPEVTVQGVILAGDQSVALLRRDDTGEVLTARPGDDLSGWHVDRIEAGSVTLTGPDGSVDLPLFPPPPP